jgi:C_GCAxxG_C_C family probable redox protein
MADPQPVDPVARACELFTKGVSCAPAVLAAVAPRFGLTEDEAARLASCFAGGMLGSGRVCGAVTGAMMALGLAHGPGAQLDPPRKEVAFARVAELWRRFAEQHGSIECKDLLGVDLSVPGAREQAIASGVFKTVCPAAVKDATQLLVELL